MIRAKKDKAMRMLTLYQRLISGDIVYKSTCAMEFEITERSFDRDIEDIRIYLSESFSWLDLIYDKTVGGYRLKNLNIKPEMGLGECFILSKLLLDSHTLRTDDQDAVVGILLSQLRPELRKRVISVLQHTPRRDSCTGKTTIKLVEDLLYSIECGDRISLQFGEHHQEVECVPYSIEFLARKAYLAAWEPNLHQPTLYPLDEIQSYLRIGPYPLGTREQAAMQALVEQVCRGNLDDSQTYIYQSKGENDI